MQQHMVTNLAAVTLTTLLLYNYKYAFAEGVLQDHGWSLRVALMVLGLQ
jgi:hypothetical protein